MSMDTADDPLEVSLVNKMESSRRNGRRNNLQDTIDRAHKKDDEGGMPIANHVRNVRWRNGILDNVQSIGDQGPKKAEEVDLLIASDLSSLPTLSLSEEKSSEEGSPTKLVCLARSDEENIFSESFSSLPIRAPITYLRKKLLILDLNGVLVDVVSRPPKDHKADIKIAKRAIFRRPFWLDFLNFSFGRFEVGIWSSRLKKNIDRLVDFLMGDLKHKLLFLWDLSHCTTTKFRTLEDKRKLLVFKEVRRLWEKHEPELPWRKGYFNESNTLLVDDSPYKALLNPAHTAIFPYSYQFQDRNDNSLGNGGDLRVYLEDLAASTNVQEYVEQHPFGQRAITEISASWGFYLQAIQSLQSFPVTQMR